MDKRAPYKARIGGHALRPETLMLTIGLNWYPDIGIRFMANWIRVLQLAAPYNQPLYNGIHPDIFVMRAQVYW